MIKTSQKIAIEQDNIFANDLLDRKQSIKDLSDLIKTQKEPLVLGINADWGAGKTTFVQLWQAHLKKEHKIEGIYFSAWEDDFSDEPLVSILGELNVYIERLNQKETDKKFEVVKENAVKVIKKSLPIAVKGLASKLIGNDAAAEISEVFTETLIDDYKTNKNDLQKLKESIAEVLETINPDKPFVIFIDELDRCRPLYAIELLERIKHIFDIERLIFVLSMDKNNLAKSIQSQYGNIDTDNYLRRFIHLEYPLKTPSVDKFCKVLFRQFELVNLLKSKEISHDYTYDLDLISQLSVIFKLSLRQIEQIFSKLHIFCNTIPPRFYPEHLSIFILFECLKSNDSQLYYDFLAGIIPAEIDNIVLNGLNKNERIKNHIKAVIATTPLRNNPEDLQAFMDKQQTDDGFISALKWNLDVGSYGLSSLINTVIKHIDFAEKFNFSINEQN